MQSPLKKFVAISISAASIFLLCSLLFAAATTGTKVVAQENNNNSNNIFRPTSLIVTKTGGAIVVLDATLHPPITTEGYHTVSLAWCSKQDWYDCLNSSNETSKCRCGVAGFDVESSVRFQQQQQQDDQQEESAENMNHNNKDCTVVSHSWAIDEDYKAAYEKLIKEKKLKREELSRKRESFQTRLNVLSNKFNNFNQKENITDITEYLAKIDQLENEMARLREHIAAFDRESITLTQEFVRHNLNNLGRVVKLHLFCSTSSSRNKKINFDKITAQTTVASARWTPSHTLLIETSSSSATKKQTNSNNNEKSFEPEQEQNQQSDSSNPALGGVRMAATISQNSHVDWNDVRISLRQGAPGEDSTTDEVPPNDDPLSPWIVTIKAEPPQRGAGGNTFMNQQQLRNQMNTHVKMSMKKSQESASSAMFFSASNAMDAGAAEQANVEQDEPEFAAASPPEASTSILSGSTTEETILPHPVTIPKSSATTIEIGKGDITSSLHRVVAAYRCRPSDQTSSARFKANNIFTQQQQQQDQSSVKKQVCALPVFLRSNVTNLNPFSILGGPTRVIVDGIPFNPFGRNTNSINNNNNNLPNLPSIAPFSWNWVDLGEDTRIRVQRYEKSNIMSGVEADKDKAWWETLVKSEAPRNHVAVKFEIRIVNTHKAPVSIDLRDQFPRTNSDEVEIKLDGETLRNKFLTVETLPSKTAKCAHRHPDDASKCVVTKGGSGEEIQWKVEAGAGETIVIPFGFTITWNKAKFLHGLI